MSDTMVETRAARNDRRLLALAPRWAAILFALGTTLVPQRASAGAWSDDYRRGLRALEAQDLAGAERYLQRAVAQEPTSHLGVRTYGTRAVDYLPNLYLSIVAYRRNDLPSAERFLAREVEQGVAATSPESRVLLKEQEILLENLRLIGAAAPPARAPESARSVAEREAAALRELNEDYGAPARDTGIGRGRWYFHYLEARRLSQRGDWVGSLRQLASALALRPEPGQLVRTYGMGFVEYRPWFELGRAHAQLGNWRCASDALELSTEIEPMPPQDAVFARERAELLAGARTRLAAQDGGVAPAER